MTYVAVAIAAFTTSGLLALLFSRAERPGPDEPWLDWDGEVPEELQ